MMESIKKLREICQKPVIHLNTWYSRNFARRISIYFTWLFILLKFRANAISLFMLFTGIVGSFLFSFGSYWYYISGVLVLQFWYVLDHSDGELARYWKESSAKGVFLDKLCHHIVHPLLFLFIGIGLWRQYNNSFMLILGGFTAYLLLLQDFVNTDKREAIEFFNIKNNPKKLHKSNFFGLLFTKVTELVYKIPGMMNILMLAAISNVM